MHKLTHMHRFSSLEVVLDEILCILELFGYAILAPESMLLFMVPTRPRVAEYEG